MKYLLQTQADLFDICKMMKIISLVRKKSVENLITVLFEYSAKIACHSNFHFPKYRDFDKICSFFLFRQFPNTRIVTVISQRCLLKAKTDFELRLAQKTLDHQVFKKEYEANWKSKKERYSKTLNRIFIQVLRQSKYIQQLQIDNFYKLSDKGLLYLGHFLKQFSRLKSFSLKIPDFYGNEIKTSALRYFRDGIKRFTSLESLSLDFGFGCLKIEDKGLGILTRGFRKQISLRKISLSFAYCDEITDSGIHDLVESLKNLIFLQRISLNFHGCKLIRNEGFISLEKFLKKLKNLRSINLNFGGISLSAVEHITQRLKTLSLLQNIAVKIYGYKFIMNIEENSQKISQQIGPEFWQENAKVRFNSLRELLKTLQKDNINIEYFYEIDDFKVKHLKQDLKNLNSLEKIHLKFWNRYQVTDEKLEEIVQSVKDHACLKDLYFNFYNCGKLTDKGLQHASIGLEAFCSLQKLCLKFYCFTLMTNKGLESISRGLKKMVCLEKLKFRFVHSSGIDNFGVEMIAQSLEKLLVLREFTLIVARYSKVTRAGIDKVIEDLKNHVSLQKVFVHFYKYLEKE